MKDNLQKIKDRPYLVAIVLLFAISVFLNAFLAIRTNQLNSESFIQAEQKYPRLDPAQGFFDNSDLLITLAPLHDDIQNYIQTLTTSSVSVYFEFMNTGANFSINDQPFQPGSLMKIPVAMAAMKDVDDGTWSLDQTTITLADSDKDSAYGTLYLQPTGSSYTVRTLLSKLLVDSDNTARTMFIRSVGQNSINDVLNYLGLQDIFNSELEVGLRRYSNFFRALYEASYLSPESSEQLLNTMNEPHDETWLRSGIPANIDFSHKIGYRDGTYSDAGIVYATNRPYILAVVVKASSTDGVAGTMNRISTLVYDYVTQNGSGPGN